MAEVTEPSNLKEIQRGIALLKRQQSALKARDDLIDFSRFVMPDPDARDDPEASRYEAAKHHRALAAGLEEVEKANIPFLIVTMPPRHGKQIADDVPVPTPSGYRMHGELRPGDFVFGPDGKPTRVVAVASPASQDVEIEFSNGERIRCHENHEWHVNDRRRHRFVTVETKDIERDPWAYVSGRRGSRARWQLPDEGSVEYPHADQPLHPYTLGVWLGDGTTTKPMITGVDEEVFAGVAECSGFEETGRYVHVQTGVTTVAYGGPRPNCRGQLSEQLHALGLYGDKHIPHAYQIASREQRLQLLAGLMDTDGHCEKDTGRCRVVTCSIKLAEDILVLAQGLGFRPYITSQDPTTSSSGIVGRQVVYTVGFQPTEKLPVRLARKQPQRFAPRRKISIRAVRRVAPHTGRCIQVDREDGLYLVGTKFVVTHNSQLVSRHFPAWLLGRHPDWHIAVGTYSDEFAMDFGSEVRRLIVSPAYKQIFPQIHLTKGGAAKDRLQTTQGGMAFFVGVGGAMTGRGAHCLVLDDIFKDYEQARSQAYRDRAWKWFTTVAMTRRMGLKLVVITMTRWHADDVIGRLTDPENPNYSPDLAKKIKVIDLPAVAGADDPLGREVGEPLWPSRFDLEFLEEQRSLDPMGFEALYQQRPSVADGVLFRRDQIRYFDPNEIDESQLRIYCSSDHAVATGQRNDFTALIRIGIDRQNRIYVLNCWWQKARADVVVEAMLSMARMLPRPLIWWAEKGHISKSIGPFLNKRMQETETFFNVVEVTPAGDKEQRAQAISARVALGFVYFPKGAPWTEKAINELLAFPNGLHDDFVDAFAYIGLGLQSQVPAGAPRAKESAREGTFGNIKRQQRDADKRMSLLKAGGF